VSDAQHVVRLASQGDGVTDGGRYVAGVAPGDRVRFDGDAVIIEPGPHHRKPPCRHFPECGGCQLQHVDDAAYADWVAARIVHAVEAQGVTIGAVEPVHLSPPNSRRRASLRAMRRGRDVAIGFNEEASQRIVDMHECHILAPPLFALVAPLRGLLSSLLGDGRGAGVALTLTDAGIDLLLSKVDVRPLKVVEELTQFAIEHDVARISVETASGLDVIVQTRSPVVRLGGVEVAVPPAAFLQATRDGEAALQSAVLQSLIASRRRADLFCGVGTFALPLSTESGVHAIDSAGPAVEALDRAARSSGRRVSTELRDLFRRPLRAEELKRFDAVVIDPPRAGAKEQVAELARSKLSVVAAVSCNPNSFARDAAILVAGGFRLERLWPVGQFRWSTHVELAARFTR
jgi:23S rRNA (uracil1939-C5)-methyltransferase